MISSPLPLGEGERPAHDYEHRHRRSSAQSLRRRRRRACGVLVEGRRLRRRAARLSGSAVRSARRNRRAAAGRDGRRSRSRHRTPGARALAAWPPGPCRRAQRGDARRGRFDAAAPHRLPQRRRHGRGDDAAGAIDRSRDCSAGLPLVRGRRGAARMPAHLEAAWASRIDLERPRALRSASRGLGRSVRRVRWCQAWRAARARGSLASAGVFRRRAGAQIRPAARAPAEPNCAAEPRVLPLVHARARERRRCACRTARERCVRCLCR